jgi:hypothetical protein
VEQGSILPHRIHPEEEYPLDVCRQLQDTLMHYVPDAASGFDWCEYLEHPSYERIGEDLQNQTGCCVSNYTRAWALVCTEVAWALCRDHSSHVKEHQAQDKHYTTKLKLLTRGIENATSMDVLWMPMKMIDIESLNPQFPLENTLKIEVMKRFNEFNQVEHLADSTIQENLMNRLL